MRISMIDYPRPDPGTRKANRHAALAKSYERRRHEEKPPLTAATATGRQRQKFNYHLIAEGVLCQ